MVKGLYTFFEIIEFGLVKLPNLDNNSIEVITYNLEKERAF